MRPAFVFLAALMMCMFAYSNVSGMYKFNLWPLPAPEDYGNIMIDRTSSKHNVMPVTFSHWLHRAKFTCRVCHFELDFALSSNETEITEADNRKGLFCGACHNGDIAFAHTAENCDRCHTGNISSSSQKFAELRESLPHATYGNEIDWAEALRKGLIRPKYSLYKDEKPLDFSKVLELRPEWSGISPAVFPHAAHVAWLDCANCHPDIFNIKKKTTKHFEMRYILQKKFCGVCHLTVALPIDDCNACHPKMR